MTMAPDRNRQRAAAYLRRARVHLAGLRAIRAEIDRTLDGPRPMQIEAERASERLLLRMLRYAGIARALARRAGPVAALALVLGAWTEPPRTMAGAFACDVERVIDGDTIVCGDGRHIRLRGVDTPERGDRARFDYWGATGNKAHHPFAWADDLPRKALRDPRDGAT